MTKWRPANLIYVFVILQTLEIFCGGFFRDENTWIFFAAALCMMQKPPANLIRVFVILSSMRHFEFQPWPHQIIYFKYFKWNMIFGNISEIIFVYIRKCLVKLQKTLSAASIKTSWQENHTWNSRNHPAPGRIITVYFIMAFVYCI
jgi:hypothetical protein